MDELILIAGMAFVTYLTRVLPFFFRIGESRYLRFVPTPVFSALIFPEILSEFKKLIVGVLLFGITFKNNNLLVAFVIGVVLLYLINLFQRIYL